MKPTITSIYILLILCLAACQSAAPTSLPTSTQAIAADTKTSIPTSTETPQPESTSALDAFLLTKAAVTPNPTFDVRVPADACWIRSEVSVVTGQNVRISATGTVNTYGGRDGSNSEPEGQTAICGAVQCPVQGVGYGALIGRLEDLKAFFVGSYHEFTATKDGQLYFTVNDWECEDNYGAFQLTIEIE